ncbi:hypothetical protein C8034_v012062 [Colletotrichum sidae]|uniref:Uncharacterized protein n=1 Tax=Colletotrichum sidae TaxID=1347389 RepID=A0A4R8T0S2_9PEZI|nr:hypothetical protein C8034_v012062 [Colletotrichum sidae]
MAHFTPATRRMDGLAGVSMTDLDAVAERTQSAKPDNEAWEALRWLLSRPWFTRVWCVQEIVLARSSRVHVGAFSLDWPKLGVTAAWLSEQSLAFDYDIPLELEGLAWDNAYGMFDTSELSESSLLEVLVEFRDSNATDPRDKVYGLLGLVNAGELEGFPIVDYNKSVAEVYADVVKTSIAKTGHLGSLAYEAQTRFEATQPEIYPAFVQALSTFNQASPRSQEEADQNLRYLHEQVKVLLQGHYDLLERFEASLPLDYFQQRAKSEGRI